MSMLFSQLAFLRSLLADCSKSNSTRQAIPEPALLSSRPFAVTQHACAQRQVPINFAACRAKRKIGKKISRSYSWTVTGTLRTIPTIKLPACIVGLHCSKKAGTVHKSFCAMQVFRASIRSGKAADTAQSWSTKRTQ